MTIVAVGVDLVDLQRFHATCNRNPALVKRLFTAREISAAVARAGTVDAAGGALMPLPRQSAQFLAGRFAVKEAVAKALGSPGGLRWHDCETLPAQSGAPELFTCGTITKAAKQRGIATWLVSVSHDGGMVIAMVMGGR